VDQSQDASPVWVNVALEGVYRGHPMHPVVDFRREVFDAVVANLHSHPDYEAGANGVGMSHVVPYDYEHASEMDPTRGSVPQQGAPAAGWVLDLEVRDAPDGTAQLWALTEFLPAALEQVRSGAYENTSVCVWPNGKDPVSGKAIGPVLTSVALTNHPFIQGLERIAASVSVWGEAESPEEAVVGLRDIFGLGAEADAAAVLVELEQFQRMLVDGTAPSWLEPEYLVSNIRGLLGLRTLATREEIFAEAVRMLSGLVSQGGGSDATQSPEPPTAETEMEATQLTAKLATILGCRDKDDAILAAAEKAVEQSNESQDALNQLLQLFESKDFTDVLAKATTAIADAKKADTMVTALNDALSKLGAVNETEADAEAEAVAAHLSGNDKQLCSRLLPGIQSSRRACLQGDGTVDEVKLAKFREHYPLPEKERQYLSSRIVAGPNGTQLGGAATAAPQGPQAPPTGPITASQQRAGTEPDPNSSEMLSQSYAGRNRIEKAVSYLCSNRKGFDGQDRADQIQQASAWLKQPAAQQ